jgi:simple sugar transport system permease protein
LFIVAAVFFVAWFISKRTAIGLFVESVGTNASSSSYSGINEKNVKLFVYVFCAVCAGIAGLIISSNIKSADANNAGLLTELYAILAVVIGGTLMSGGRFYLWGSLIGAIIVQSMTTSIYAFGVPAETAYVVTALVVLAVVLLYSDMMKVFMDRIFERKGTKTL